MVVENFKSKIPGGVGLVDEVARLHVRRLIQDDGLKNMRSKRLVLSAPTRRICSM